jgi:hypothetical protein
MLIHCGDSRDFNDSPVGRIAVTFGGGKRSELTIDTSESPELQARKGDVSIAHDGGLETAAPCLARPADPCGGWNLDELILSGSRQRTRG